ncbi:MAG: hypothetical protein IJU63_05975 [Bacteroidales bacterium]|nr:hypothetical protein [Bacteroidales bacterium]MCR5276517.1 hypothetical protein [Bacteroidales bacterium]
MRKWIRRVLRGASFTSMLFIFQACYGTGPANYPELPVEEEVELVEEEAVATPDGAGEVELTEVAPE